MSDTMTSGQRHVCMSHIHSKGTKPELKVRKWLWSHGYRYRLNVKSVPGKPDIVMRPYRTAIFVNGCFWHGHKVIFDKGGGSITENSLCCRVPKTNQEFWVAKIRRNQERDLKNYYILGENGWQVIVIWECQLKTNLFEQTMRKVELLLNENLLALHRHKSVPYSFDILEGQLPMAAENAVSFDDRG